MKKKVLMGIVLLTIVTASSVLAQNQQKFVLEIYNISEATYNAFDRMTSDAKVTREDQYFFVRTASGTALRSKDQGLSLEQARQKLLTIDPRNTRWVNQVNDGISIVQQKWGTHGIATYTPQYTIYYWLRRTE